MALLISLEWGQALPECLTKGVIVDLDKTVESIHAALEEAERMVGYKINEVYAGMVGSHVSLINNRGVVAVSREDKEITEEDTARVLQAAKVIAIPRIEKLSMSYPGICC